MLRMAAVLILFIAPANDALAQLIPWKLGTKLTWADFAGPPNKGNDFAAEARYHINYKYRWEGDGSVHVTVECCFDVQKAWKKPEKNLTPQLLAHEQLHFDIAELYTRKMRQAYMGYTAFHKHTENTDADIKKIFDRLMAECNDYNVRYDAESDHSKTTAKQQEWEAKIAVAMDGMSPFAD